MPRPNISAKSLLDGFRALGPLRLAAMGVVALGLLAMLGIVAGQNGGRGRMELLYGNLDLREAGQMAEQLDKAHIPHDSNAGGDELLVPDKQVAAARLLLARSGLPSGGSVGYEIFDRGDNLTATQFEQTINQTRALEGELARSIRLIKGVRAARVHLVLPHREPFAAEQTAAQASVMLSMNGAARLDAEGVQAVLNLVAAAVPGLKPQNIAIVDDRGSVLSRSGVPAGTLGAAQSVEELRQATELRLAHAVEEMLEPSLGAEHVRAEAAVTMDVDQLKETQESFDPNGQVLRSQQTVSDKNRSTDGSTNTTVSNNLPNASAGQAQSGSQQDRQEETSNYEINKTVRTLVRDQPRLSRISLAVMVDGQTVADATGKSVWTPRSKTELDQIAVLAKSAIGFDEKRGDTVSVVSMPFTTTHPAAEPPAPRGLFGTTIDQATAAHVGQNLLLGVLLLLGVMLVVRPMVGRRDEAAVVTVPDGIVRPGGGGASAQTVSALAAPVAATAPGTSLVAVEEDAMVTIARVDGEMRAAS
ncbi:MAG: flagellar M-ring protein FliF, partial [Jatrophihabitans endophyticus]|nr:flagellar M-ring protein FliF [Jatrophihabitans endophyticus]